MLARVQVPASVQRGEIIEVRIAIQHPMETGFRYDNAGRAIPKNVVNTLIARYNGIEIFRAEMGSGIRTLPRNSQIPDSSSEPHHRRYSAFRILHSAFP